MKTIYQCEVCGFSSSNHDAVASCEGRCKLAMLLEDIFGSDEWKPPLPLRQFKQWSHGDRSEMARRIDGFYSKHFR
jgi:hypothetical protein